MNLDITNARAEIVKKLTNWDIPLKDIQAAKIEYDNSVPICLFPGHSDSEFDKWLSIMNKINYYAGYGNQVLFGTIWLKHGLWMTRGEYDGSEWWEVHVRPPLPKQEDFDNMY
tara:strand:+ start:2298 stop:2636 length:339 start_codon:yes stop_codon:yes gene_type:complete